MIGSPQPTCGDTYANGWAGLHNGSTTIIHSELLPTMSFSMPVYNSGIFQCHSVALGIFGSTSSSSQGYGYCWHWHRVDYSSQMESWSYYTNAWILSVTHQLGEISLANPWKHNGVHVSQSDNIDGPICICGSFQVKAQCMSTSSEQWHVMWPWYDSIT